MKICPKCSSSKDESLFHKSSRRKDGLTLWCKSCVADSNVARHSLNPQKRVDRRTRITQESREFVYSYLLTHPCVDCGNTDPRVLEFDHVRGEKKASISELVRTRHSLKAIKLEIDKCEVRCANCHRIKTSEQFSWWMTTKTPVISG